MFELLHSFSLDILGTSKWIKLGCIMKFKYKTDISVSFHHQTAFSVREIHPKCPLPDIPKF